MFGGQTVFEGLTNIKQRNVSEGPGGNSKITSRDDKDNIERKNINNKNYGRVNIKCYSQYLCSSSKILNC